MDNQKELRDQFLTVGKNLLRGELPREWIIQACRSLQDLLQEMDQDTVDYVYGWAGHPSQSSASRKLIVALKAVIVGEIAIRRAANPEKVQ